MKTFEEWLESHMTIELQHELNGMFAMDMLFELKNIYEEEYVKKGID